MLTWFDLDVELPVYFRYIC